MTINASIAIDDLNADVRELAATTLHAFAKANERLRDARALTPNGTLQAVERRPDTDVFVALWAPETLDLDDRYEVLVGRLDGTTIAGNGARAQFLRLLRARPEITTVVHIHSYALGVWAQSHQPLPIRYAPVQRFTLARSIPSYVDRTQSQEDFILEQLELEPTLRAILEANGGATGWGSEGLLATLQDLLVLEEGAQLQLGAQGLGGSLEFGPGVLAQQWRIGQLTDAAVAAGLLPA